MSGSTVADIVSARVARLTKLLTLSTSPALFTAEVTAEPTIRTNPNTEGPAIS